MIELTKTTKLFLII